MSYKQKPIKPDTVIYPARLQEIIDAYDRANIVYPINNEDRNEMLLEDAIKARPESLQKYVVGIYRLKTQKQFVIGESSDEALVYYMQRSATLYNGQPVQDNRPLGYYWNPVTKVLTDVMGKPIKYNLTKTVPFFKIPFSPEAVDKIMEESDIDVTQFYIGQASNNGPELVQNNLKYQIWNLDDFKQANFQELWDMGKYNYTAKEARLDAWRKEGQNIRKQTQNLNILTQNNKV